MRVTVTKGVCISQSALIWRSATAICSSHSAARHLGWRLGASIPMGYEPGAATILQGGAHLIVGEVFERVVVFDL